MTQVLDPSANGNALVRATQQSDQLASRSVGGHRGVAISSFEDLWRMSKAISSSGMAPKGVQSPEAIFTVIQFGAELGMGPMAALQSIANINGRPAIFGDSALALVRNSGLCDYYLELASNDAVHALAEQLAVAMELDEQADVKRIRRELATAAAKVNRAAEDFGYTSVSQRAGAVASIIRRFTIADAKKARLWGKEGPWTNYPERMLMWRSRGFNLRDNFGDVLKGMYTAEEAFDVAPTAPPVRRGVAALVDKLRPSGEPVTEAARADQAADLRQQVDEAEQATDIAGDAEPDVSGADEQPPAEESTTLEATLSGAWGDAKKLMLDKAKDNGVAKSAAGAGIDHFVLRIGKKGKEDQIDVATRIALYEAIAEKRFEFETGEIIPE